jgi:hypothetical protein
VRPPSTPGQADATCACTLASCRSHIVAHPPPRTPSASCACRHDGVGDPLDPRVPVILEAAGAAGQSSFSFSFSFFFSLLLFSFRFAAGSSCSCSCLSYSRVSFVLWFLLRCILLSCHDGMDVGVKISWHLEPYDAGRGAGTSHEVGADIKYINRKYRNHPACLKTASGLAVFFVYDSYRSSAQEWTTLFTRGRPGSLRGTTDDGVFLSLVVDRTHLTECLNGGFDGFYTYFAVDKFSWGSTWKNFQVQQTFATQHKLEFYPSVGPGYNDEAVRPWNGANTRDRNNGQYYTQSWTAAIAAGANLSFWVLLSSFSSSSSSSPRMCCAQDGTLFIELALIITRPPRTHTTGEEGSGDQL